MHKLMMTGFSLLGASQLSMLVWIGFQGGLGAPVPAPGAWVVSSPAPVHMVASPAADQTAATTLNFPPVGTLSLYGDTKSPDYFAIFLSGDGGWNKGVVDMARALAADGRTLVAGVDVVKYSKKLQSDPAEKCLYPAGDMENLSEFVQKKLGFPRYLKPLLVGYSSGASMTYGLLCQAPAGTFKGGVALGFCPDILLKKPLCEGSGKLTMHPRKDGLGFDFNKLVAPGAPLEVLQGEMDQDCICENTCAFFDRTPQVKLTLLPKVGHGFSVTKNWMPQFKQAFARVEQAAAANTPGASRTAAPLPAAADLPIVVTPAADNPNQPLALFLSGDGGWTDFDQQICNHLSARGLPVMGLNCQSYFWKKKTPEQATADLAPVLRQYLKTWNRQKFMLIGYSFGANVAPFILNRLPADLREKAQSVVLLSPDVRGDFEIHVAAMLGKSMGGYDVAAEIRSLKSPSVWCVSGAQEPNDLQAVLRGASPAPRFEKLPGSHHYNNDAVKVAGLIAGAVESKP